jgi:hypothetical protein
MLDFLQMVPQSLESSLFYDVISRIPLPELNSALCFPFQGSPSIEENIRADFLHSSTFEKWKEMASHIFSTR